MIRGLCVALAAALAFTSRAPAQAGARFHWQTGQILMYRVNQVTRVTEVVEGKTTESTSRHTNQKRWQVLEVDGDGLATLQLSLTALRIETTTPEGESLVFDSADPDKSNPQMREQLQKYVGHPLAVIRVNALGKVVDVKECKFGAPSRFESEPPFGLVLPDAGLQRSWERSYQITLAPPQGTGEKFQAVQKYECRAVDGSRVTVHVGTSIPAPPEAPADQAALFQSQPEGELVFDAQSGSVRSIQLKIDRELKGQQGEGSTYRFHSEYTEEAVAPGGSTGQ